VPGYSAYRSPVKRVLVVTSKLYEVIEAVICDEISVPPPEFCSFDSRDKRNTHWSFYGSTGSDNARRIPQCPGR
jgi:hypothetical protein